ncbi:MAG TPA: PLP-dependent aspartate aminotransferase family protein [Planctomycetaceae bacterium]|nr:PLP-dependent aspartate aminotransferase family protein [Planctomycetaceae bacterium]
MADPQKLSFETRCVHAGVDIDNTFNSCTTPIYPTSTFYWEDLKTTKGFDYTRSGNPTRRAMENNIAALEGGISCRATSTGMSAITAILHLFAPGDQIIAGQDIYGGTYRLFADVFTRLGLEFRFVDMCDPANVQAAVTDKTKGIWIETPSNPLMRLTDIAAVVAIAKKCGAITVADNTFLSPYLQRPFELGVDIVMHSTTKYLNGHSDVVGGCIVTKTDSHAERIDYLVNALGLACSPFDAWLVLRGVKTLGPRMEAHQKGAMAIARFLDGHPNVETVYYPGLESHPQHELAKKQQFGFGAMLSFDIKGDKSDTERVCTQTKLFMLAESLGGVESLICAPDCMTHLSMEESARRKAGISTRTVRVSVGIESPDDLIADLKQALEG